MLAQADIAQMTTVERLQAMELLWASIVQSGDSISSPAWHKEILSARQATVGNGEGQFLSLTELKKRLHRRDS